MDIQIIEQLLAPSKTDKRSVAKKNREINTCCARNCNGQKRSNGFVCDNHMLEVLNIMVEYAGRLPEAYTNADNEQLLTFPEELRENILKYPGLHFLILADSSDPYKMAQSKLSVTALLSAIFDNYEIDKQSLGIETIHALNNLRATITKPITLEYFIPKLVFHRDNKDEIISKSYQPVQKTITVTPKTIQYSHEGMVLGIWRSNINVTPEFKSILNFIYGAVPIAVSYSKTKIDISDTINTKLNITELNDVDLSVNNASEQRLTLCALRFTSEQLNIKFPEPQIIPSVGKVMFGLHNVICALMTLTKRQQFNRDVFKVLVERSKFLRHKVKVHHTREGCAYAFYIENDEVLAYAGTKKSISCKISDLTYEDYDFPVCVILTESPHQNDYDGLSFNSSMLVRIEEKYYTDYTIEEIHDYISRSVWI